MKKTKEEYKMGRYTLVAKIYKPESYTPIVFGQTEKGRDITKVSLEQIDAFTSSFKNPAELEEYIKTKYMIPPGACYFQIEYIYNQKTHILDIFTGDTTIKKCAEYCLRQKKYKASPRLTDEVPEFIKFCKRMLYYIYAEKSLAVLKKDTTGLIPYRLKEIIQTINAEDTNNPNTSYFLEDRNDTEDKIIYILSDYKNMRQMLKWEEAYLSHTVKMQQNKENEDISFSSIQDYNFRKSEHVDPDEYAFLSEEELKQMEGGGEEDSIIDDREKEISTKWR